MFSYSGEYSSALVESTALQTNQYWHWTGEPRATERSPLHSSEREFLHPAFRATVFSFFPVPHPEQSISLPGIPGLWSQVSAKTQLLRRGAAVCCVCAEPAMTRWISGPNIQHTVAAPRAHTSLSSHRHLVVASTSVHLPSSLSPAFPAVLGKDDTTAGSPRTICIPAELTWLRKGPRW